MITQPLVVPQRWKPYSIELFPQSTISYENYNLSPKYLVNDCRMRKFQSSFCLFHQGFLLLKLAIHKIAGKGKGLSRSSHPELFCNKGVLRNFAKFTVKNKCFPVSFCEISKSNFFYRTPPVAASDHFYSSLPFTSTLEHSDICQQFRM